MDLTEALRVVRANGIGMARYLFDGGSARELADALRCPSSHVTRWLRTATALFGPVAAAERSDRDAAVAEARKLSLSLDDLVIIDTAVAKLPATTGITRERFRRELTDEAAGRTTDELQQHVTARLRDLIPDGTTIARQRRYARFSKTPDAFGGIHMMAYLPAAEASAVRNALDSVARRTYRRDGDTSFEQCRADALIAAIVSDEPPTAGALGVSVIVTPDELPIASNDNTREHFTLTDGTVISHRDILAAKLDGTSYGIVYSTLDHQPVNCFRIRRLANDKQRIMLAADQTICARPSCTFPANQSQPHHLDDWSKGGETNIDRLGLLCPSCHAKIGKEGILIRTPDGRLGWVNPKTREVKVNTSPAMAGSGALLSRKGRKGSARE